MAIAPEFSHSHLYVWVWIAEHILIAMLLLVLGFRTRLAARHGQWTLSERRVLTALGLLTVGNAAALPEVSDGLSRMAQSWDVVVLNTLVVAAMSALCGAFGMLVWRRALAATSAVIALGFGYVWFREPVMVLIFYIALNVLLVCVYAVTGLAARSGLAVAPRQQRIGLRTVVVSLALLVALASSRIVSSVLQFAGVPVGYWTSTTQILSRVFVAILIGGLTVCSVVQSRLASRNRRNHQQLHDALEPLWSELLARFPQLHMREVPDASVHLRFYRRVIECRDGLMLLSPQLRRVGAVEGVCADPHRLAHQVRQALALEPDGTGSGERAHPVAVSAGSDLDSEAEALVAVAHELSRLGSPPMSTPRPAQVVVIGPSPVSVTGTVVAPQPTSTRQPR